MEVLALSWNAQEFASKDRFVIKYGSVEILLSEEV